MEKTLIIDGKQVRFKATAATLLRYKSETGREFLVDCKALEQFVTIGEDGKGIIKDVNKLDLNLAFACAWAMAKTADKDIPDMMTWLDEFYEFNVNLVFRELVPMLLRLVKTDTKNA